MKRKDKVKVEKRWGVWNREKHSLWQHKYITRAEALESSAYSLPDKKSCMPVKVEVRYTIPQQKEKP